MISMTRNRLCLLIPVVGLGCVLYGRAQQATQPDRATPPGSETVRSFSVVPQPAADIPLTMAPDLAVPEVPASYLIGRDDLLSVFVYQMPDITRQVRVNEDGTINLPMLAAPIPAAGRTAQQVESVVAASLVRAQIAHSPQVQVTVRQVMSRPVVVSGAVVHPLVIQAAHPMTLLEVLSQAGGLQDRASDTVILTGMESGKPLEQELSLSHILGPEQEGAKILLTGGETVRVLPAQMIYVTGDLNKPGAFPVDAGENVTALKALALAQGLGQNADTKHASIVRQLGGSRQVIPVRLDRILEHQQEDVTLIAGDLLYVPVSERSKALRAGLAGGVTTLTIGLAYGIANALSRSH